MAIDHTTEVPHSSAGGNARTVVVCPDSFKGSLNSDDVAHAIAAGWRQVCPEDTLILSPMADGGEGTRRAFNTARPEAKVVELAELCGIELYEELDPWHAGTAPFGEVLREAILATHQEFKASVAGRKRDQHEQDSTENAQQKLGPAEDSRPIVHVGIGSSASTDCGAGMLQALGVSIKDAEGQPIAAGLEGVASAASIDFSPAADVLDALCDVDVHVITDVTAPLLGPRGAVQAFGPQKGLKPVDFDHAEAAIERFSDLLLEAFAKHRPSRSDAQRPARHDAHRPSGSDAHHLTRHDAGTNYCDVDLSITTPGVGAAGGVGFALKALGAGLLPGAGHVAEAIGLEEQIARADLVITGEGAFDATSLQGKVPAAVKQIADGHGVPCALVAGAIRDDDAAGVFRAVINLSELAGSARASMADTARWCEVAGSRLARCCNVTIYV
ncbi:glycerate kinase [Corynebacterium argentoratense]|uniref:glycerate kinase n=1 Tax=Corynebacterium argentoratense TaxID=42817 RepID=UPI001F3CCC53|nr:glycerate kinase [Corynebacterium argentoratense]MCF1764666.1 glycerate kinase [Corynebacterium argentoratense]